MQYQPNPKQVYGGCLRSSMMGTTGRIETEGENRSDIKHYYRPTPHAKTREALSHQGANTSLKKQCGDSKANANLNDFPFAGILAFWPP
jgi:hypothetical protein